MKTDTFPRPAFRVSTDALRRVVVETVTVHAVDRLRGVADCSFPMPGCTLRNEVPFSQLARDGRRAARLAARLILDPAGYLADRSASAAASVAASLSRSADTEHGFGASAVHRSEPARGAKPATQKMAGSVAA